MNLHTCSQPCGATRFHRPGRSTVGIRCLLVAVLVALSTGGCVSRAELITLREGMDRGTSTIRTQHLEWARLLATDNRSALPVLQPQDLRAVERAHEEYRQLVEASRSQD